MSVYAGAFLNISFHGAYRWSRSLTLGLPLLNCSRLLPAALSASLINLTHPRKGLEGQINSHWNLFLYHEENHACVSLSFGLPAKVSVWSSFFTQSRDEFAHFFLHRRPIKETREKECLNLPATGLPIHSCGILSTHLRSLLRQTLYVRLSRSFSRVQWHWQGMIAWSLWIKGPAWYFPSFSTPPTSIRWLLLWTGKSSKQEWKGENLFLFLLSPLLCSSNSTFLNVQLLDQWHTGGDTYEVLTVTVQRLAISCCVASHTFLSFPPSALCTTR